MTDLTDRKYVKKLPDAYAKGEQSNNNKLLRINDCAVTELYENITEVVNALELDNAEGVILDDYGEMFGVYRGKLTDKQYRAVIKATIAANISKGDYASVMSGLSYIFNLPKGELSVHEIENQICTVKLSDMPFTALMETGLTADQVKSILKKLLAVAIKVEESLFEGTFEFGSIPAEYDPSKVWGNAEQTIGGYLGTIITGTSAVRTRKPKIKIIEKDLFEFGTIENSVVVPTEYPTVINGETVQAGSGDPSPTNVRTISTGQKFYKEIVFTGNNTATEVYTVFTNPYTNVTAFFIAINSDIHPNNLGYSDVSPLMCSHIKTVSPKDTREGLKEGISFEKYDSKGETKFRVYLPSFNNDLTAFQSWVKSLYEAGTPLTVWLETREPTGDYYVCHSITDSDGNYRAYGEKMLGGAMYSGDTYDLKTGIETHTKAKIVLDGTQAGKAEYVEGGAKRYKLVFANDDPYAPINPPTTEECRDGVISDYLKSLAAGYVWSGIQGISLEFHSTKMIQIHIDGCTTLEEYNAYLAEHPLTVIYKLATPITYQHEPFYSNKVSVPFAIDKLKGFSNVDKTMGGYVTTIAELAKGGNTLKGEVTIESATNGAEIYYTLNGNEPTNSATKYSAPFDVEPNTTVKAIAYSYGLDPSNIAEKSFTE